MGSLLVNSLNLSLQVVDSATQKTTTDFETTLNSPASVAQGTQYLAIPQTTTASIPLPATTCYQLFVKNVSQNGWINVFATFTGGTEVQLGQLFPGEVLVFWSKAGNKGGVNGGFTLVQIEAEAYNGLVEYFIGA